VALQQQVPLKPVGRFLFWVAFEIDICSLGLAPKDFVAPLIALFGEGWTRCFYSRNWQCRVAALTHLSAMAQRLEDLPWSTGRLTSLNRFEAQWFQWVDETI
jgi:hypothetical protein